MLTKDDIIALRGSKSDEEFKAIFSKIIQPLIDDVNYWSNLKTGNDVRREKCNHARCN